jgi:hypothetical protein
MSSAAPLPSSVIVVGGRDSGKSNFIFRLWVAINEGCSAIRSNGLPDQLDYLKTGAESLLKAEFAQRTQHGVASVNVIPFSLAHGGAEHAGNLIVPDCQGERWTDVFTKREWSGEWEQRITDPCGVLIFVRAASNEIVPSISWLECEQLFGTILPEGEVPPEFVAPTQVVITDLIQFFGKAFMDRLGHGYKPRIALVISAWDLVPHDRQAAGPVDYIAREFPLLAQFISANDDRFEFAAFGVTIAGGDFDKQPGFREKVLGPDSPHPLAGGYVIHESNGAPAQESDLTIPVAWAMGFTRNAEG